MEQAEKPVFDHDTPHKKTNSFFVEQAEKPVRDGQDARPTRKLILSWWNRPKSLFLTMIRPTRKLILSLWNRPKSLFLTMIQDVS
ncbi:MULTISPECIES: hypothetical protein [unclassified Microcoleus]|uniref:hypothetical protein n=1 Tax=unclassified Microcoleus TaxID=2642155 RepID=UPI002FD2A272